MVKSKDFYSEYINSELWRVKRKQFIDSLREKKCCAKCKVKYSSGFHVHHMSYKRLGDEKFSDLMLLCEKCHLFLHRDKPKNVSLKTWSLIFVGLKQPGKKKSKPKKKSLVSKNKKKQQKIDKTKQAIKPFKPIEPGTIVVSQLRKKSRLRKNKKKTCS